MSINQSPNAILCCMMYFIQRQSQLSTQWLGEEDDVLEGFDWRGGGDSHTKGIHLWPEPIIVTVERTGEKVRLLLYLWELYKS